jgi:hypothetical protein
MSTPSHGSPPPLTPSQVEEWMATAHTKHGELHLLATEPLYSTLRDQAVLQMSKLLQEAIENVRVMSAALRDESQAVPAHVATLREHSDQLINTSTPFEIQVRTRDMQQAEVPVLHMVPDAMQRLEGDNTSQNGPRREGVV